MKFLKIALMSIVILVISSGMCWAKELQQHIDEVQKELTEENIHYVLDVTRLLKESGASFQKNLTAPVSVVNRYQPGENLLMMIGVYQFDALYAAAFGKKKLAGGFLNAQSVLIDKMNLRGRIDVSVIFPTALKAMVQNPETMTIDRVIESYATNADSYHRIMDDPIGFDTIESSLYGLVVEGLYVLSETLVMSGDAREASTLLNRQISLPDREWGSVTLLDPLEKGIDLMLKLYKSFEGDPQNYARFADKSGNPRERVERTEWLKNISDIIKKIKRQVTPEGIALLSETVAKEREKVIQP